MQKNNPLKIQIILGSTRQNRFGDKPAKWITELASKNGEIKVELLDLRDYPLPFFNEKTSVAYLGGKYSAMGGAEWAKKVAEADAYILVTPEYNHGPSAVLKNSLDYAYAEWNKKPVAFVAYGSAGGARAVEQLRLSAVEFQMAPIRNAVHIFNPWELVDDKGDLKPGVLDAYNDRAKAMLEELIWWGKALKEARA